MKKILIFIAVIFLFAGCQEKFNADTSVITTGQHTEINVEDEDMKGKIVADIKDTNSWCKAGSQWQFSGTNEQGLQTGNWEIVELVTTGKYAGLCHVTMEAQGTEGTSRMDYYFSEDGESGYYEIEANGQKIAQEWHK